MIEELSERRNWSDEELDLIVSDYFLMLNDEAAGIPFNKAQHNRGDQLLVDGIHLVDIDVTYTNGRGF